MKEQKKYIYYREATQSDATDIATSTIEAWKIAYKNIIDDPILETLDAERFTAFAAQKIAQNETITYVAEDQGAVIGHVNFDREIFSLQSHAEIYTLYVHPSYWKQGIGKRLFNIALEALQKKGSSGAKFWVIKQNKQAIDFYKSQGFVESQETRINSNLVPMPLEEGLFTKLFS